MSCSVFSRVVYGVSHSILRRVVMNSRVLSHVLAVVVASVVVAVCLASTAQADVIAQWKFEQGANFLADSVGGHDLVQSSGDSNVAWAAGPGGSGGAAAFNAWSSLATAAALDLSSYRHLRVSWSMNETTDWQAAATRFVFDHNWTQTATGGGMCMTVGGNLAGLDWSGGYVGNSFAYAPTGSWVDFDVELNLDGATQAERLKIFKNGVLVGTPVYTQDPPPAFSATALFSLGAYAGQAGGTPNKFGGLLTNVTIESIPEPGTIVLLATGLMGLLAYAWRKRK
jgi:hypothetical protein